MTIKKLPPFDLKVGYEWMELETVMGGEFAEGQYWLDDAKGPIAPESLFSTTRASGINLPDAAGEYQSIDVNELPRTDRGLYVNGQFTNRTGRVNPSLDQLPVKNLLTEAEGFAGQPLSLHFAGATGVSGQNRGFHATQNLTAGEPYTASVLVKMIDGEPPVFGSSTANNPANTFSINVGSNAIDPLLYQVQKVGSDVWKVSVSGLFTSGIQFGVFQSAFNQPRAFNVCGLQVLSGLSPSDALVPGSSDTGGPTLLASDIRTIPGERPNDNPPELLSNPGGPFTTTDGWGRQDSNITMSIEDGKIRTDFVGASNYVRTAFPTVPGWEYIVELEYELGSNSTAMGVEIRNQDTGAGEPIVGLTYTDSGFTSVSFTAISETTNLNVRTQKTNPATSYIKSASVKLANGMPEPFPEWETKGFDSKVGIAHNIAVDLLNSTSPRVISSFGLDKWNSASLYIDSDNRIKAALTKLGPELRSTASVLTVGSPETVATFSTNNGNGTFNRVDASNNSGVQIPATAGKTYLIDITGASGFSIRSNGFTGTNLTTAGSVRTKYVLTLPSGTAFYLCATGNSQSGSFSLHSIREITMPLILQSDPITVLGDYEVEFDAKPGAYALRVSNGIAGDSSTSNEPLPDGISIMRIGSDIDGANPFNGWIKDVQVLKVE